MRIEYRRKTGFFAEPCENHDPFGRVKGRALYYEAADSVFGISKKNNTLHKLIAPTQVECLIFESSWPRLCEPREQLSPRASRLDHWHIWRQIPGFLLLPHIPPPVSMSGPWSLSVQRQCKCAWWASFAFSSLGVRQTMLRPWLAVAYFDLQWEYCRKQVWSRSIGTVREKDCSLGFRKWWWNKDNGQNGTAWRAIIWWLIRYLYLSRYGLMTPIR